jgi:exodeoxyribonuclease VII large subunit
MQLDFDLKGTPEPVRAAAQPAEPKMFTVTALTRKVRSLLEGGLGDVWVEGEISNLRNQSSGHLYFTLKDAGSQIACVLFAGQTAQLRGKNFADGIHVQLQGQITVYEPRGNYQLIVRRVQERGIGALQAKFEQLKCRLEAEGLFRAERKRPLPRFPRRIGVVTSPTGAAIQDFLNVLHRRQSGIEVLIFPVRVQGKGAAAEIAQALRSLGDHASLGIAPLDVLVVTRGGGSLEDLWEFNEEAVARAVAESPVPVVSAVGHEIDFTICDFAADFRAPTPSAAAEILSSDSVELLEQLGHLSARMRRAVLASFELWKGRLASLPHTALFLEPQRRLREVRQTLDRHMEDLQFAATAPSPARLQLERFALFLAQKNPEHAVAEKLRTLAMHGKFLSRHTEACLRECQTELAQRSAVLNALSPAAALARGYTITLDENNVILRSAVVAAAAGSLQTRFHDGTVRSHPEPLG